MVWYVLVVPLEGRISRSMWSWMTSATRRCALLVGEEGMLCNLEGLSVGVQKPLQSFSFDESVDGQTLLLAALPAPPQHHIGR
jgi:hypothetical protein